MAEKGTVTGMDMEWLAGMIYNDLRREYDLERTRGRRLINPYIFNASRGAGHILYQKWEHGPGAPGDMERIRWELSCLNEEALALLEEHYRKIEETLQAIL